MTATVERGAPVGDGGGDVEPGAGRLRPALVAITLAHLGLLLVWSLVVPTFRAPDEHVHHDFLRHLTTTWSYPEYDELDVSRRTLDALGVSPAYPADHAAVPEEAATHRPDRPSWSDLGPDVRNGPANQMPQHPPLYYEAAAAVLRVLDGDGTAPFDRIVWELRVLNVLLMAPLPLVAADVARRFTRSTPLVLAAAAGVLAVPQLTHIGASVSNDPLMVVLGSLAVAGAARLATGDRRWGTAGFTGATAGLALFTKGFAIPVVPAVALACLLPLAPRLRRGRGGVAPRLDAAANPLDPAAVGFDAAAVPLVADAGRGAGERHPDLRARGHEPVDERVDDIARRDDAGGESRRADEAAPVEPVGRVLARAGVVAALALVLGGWWWIRNVVAYGTPQPGVRLRDRVPGVEHDIVKFGGDFGERIVTSFWGSFGWFEARLPLGLSIALTVLVVGAAAVACWRSWPRLVLLLPVVVASGMVLSSGWGAFKKTGVSYATQGRYLFAGVMSLSVLVALGVARLVRRRSWWQPLATLVAALGLQAAGLWICLGRYWAGDGVDERVQAMVAFAPVPAPVTAAAVLLASLASLAAVVVVAAGLRDRSPQEMRG